MKIEKRLKKVEEAAPEGGLDNWHVVHNDPAEYQRLIAEGVPEERIWFVEFVSPERNEQDKESNTNEDQ